MFTPPADKTVLSLLDPVSNLQQLVHTADADKTRQFSLVRVGGVNKPLLRLPAASAQFPSSAASRMPTGTGENSWNRESGGEKCQHMGLSSTMLSRFPGDNVSSPAFSAVAKLRLTCSMTEICQYML